jgi:hypothetical protein
LCSPTSSSLPVKKVEFDDANDEIEEEEEEEEVEEEEGTLSE